MFLGFAIKVPMFPFHTWLPDAHTEAPTVGSVLLAAILLKLGTYGFIRIALPILPEAAESWAPWIGLLAVIGIIYGALGCLAQTDMKRLIAFSSVAHMGFVMLGIATLTTFGINAADLRHGRARSHHRHAVLHRRLGAAQLRHPRDVAARRSAHAGAEDGLDPRLLRDGVARAARASPASGASSRRSCRRSSPARGLSRDRCSASYMVVAAIGTVLAAGYLLWMLQKVAFGDAEAGVRRRAHPRRDTYRVDRVDADPRC